MAKILDKIITKKFLVFGIIWLMLLGYSSSIFAQVPDQKRRPRDSATSFPNSQDPVNEEDILQQDTTKRAEVVDTIPVTYYYQGEESRIYVFADTTLDRYFHQHDPSRRKVFEAMHLGNVGSAVRPMLVTGARPWGLDWGFHPFDLYYHSVDSLPFYTLGRALTDTYFSFKGQANSVFRAKFSKQFQDGFQFSLQYTKINQFGQFLSQTAKVSSLATGLQYRHPKQRYTAYLTLGAHTAQNKDNGGLTTDSLFFRTGFELPETQPIRLNTAQTLQSRKKYQLYHFYKLGNFEKGNYLALRHKLWLSKNSYKFFDNNKILDTLYYGAFLTDGRGVRQAFSGDAFGNEFSISFRGHRSDSKEFEWLPTMGISVVNYRTNQSVFSDKTTHISLLGNWNITLAKIFDLKAKARLGLVGYSGDYLLSGQLGINTNKAGKWTLNADFQSVTPSLLAQKNYSTQVLVWENNFKKEFINRIGGTYSLPSLHLILGANVRLLTNHIYYGTGGQVYQDLKTIPVTQLFVRNEFKVRGFHLSNDLLYQKIVSENIRRPDFYVRQQLYWKGNLFDKALMMKAGVAHRFFSAWQPESYQPAIGQFVLQDSLTSPSMSGFDVFATFRVKSFRFLAKMENIQYYWDKRVFYQTAFYPQFKPSFRMGIAWLFRD